MRTVRNRLAIIFSPVLLAAGYLAGAYSFANDLWPIRGLRDAKRATLGEAELASRSDQLGRLVAYSGKQEIACPAQDARTAVILFLGQSIQSNSAGQRAVSAHGERLAAWFDGKCTVAQSPLLGSTDAMGEALTPFGNRLVSQGLFERVVLVPSAMGGTTIARWASGGDLNAMLSRLLDAIASHYRITHVIWHQGEDDFSHGTSAAIYMQQFGSVAETIRAHRVDAPIFVSVATRCDDDTKWRPDNPIARAQRALHDPARGIYRGVDTDALLQRIDRYDDCHLGASGIEKYAEALVEAIRSPQ